MYGFRATCVNVVVNDRQIGSEGARERLTAERVVLQVEAAAVQAGHGGRLQQHDAHVGARQQLAQPVLRRGGGLRHGLGPVQVQHGARRGQPQ